MYSINTLIVIVIVVVVGVVTISSMMMMSTKDSFCNCRGMGWKTARPTYYVYRPGDVSNYAGSSANPIEGEVPLMPMQGLGWPTGMPYDAFEQSQNSPQNYFAMGGGGSYSHPMMSMGPPPGENGGNSNSYNHQIKNFRIIPRKARI